MDPVTGAAVDNVVRCDPMRPCRACLETEGQIQSVYDRDMRNPVEASTSRGA